MDFNDHVSVVDNTAVSQVPMNRDIIAAVSDHAIMDDGNAETKMGTCELESESPVVATKKALRPFKIVTQYYHALCSDEKLSVNTFCIEKDLGRQLSSSM